MKLFIKRFLLIVIGIFLSLVLLECGLRLVGWTISSYQQYKNNKALRNKHQYTIICLGESTTAWQYPIQLQQILNKKYPNKFSVIDCGIPGTNMETILDLLDININKYNPDITICMMGVNDILIDINNQKTGNIKHIEETKSINLKIYKLYLLMNRHLTNLKQKKNAFAKELSIENNSLFKHANDLINMGKFKEAEKTLKNILKNNPNNEETFVTLSFLYTYYLHEIEIGYNMALKALDKKFFYQKEWYYKIIFDFISMNKNYELMKYYIDRAINEDSEIFSSREKYNLYNHIKKQLTESQNYKILKIMMEDDDKYYGMLAIESMEQKDYQKAKEYFDKAEEIRLNFPNTETYNLYKLIIKKLIDNNIKTICMQYPIRSIKPLQEQLKNESYYDKITFISNEKLFKDALTKKNYDEIFNDQFAGDFGHCTDLGNTLIAKNVVNTLEEILDLKQN